MNNKIALIIPTYNNSSMLLNYIDDLQKQISSSFHVFIADVSETEKKLKLPAFCTQIFIENKGFSYAVNMGVREAQKNGFGLFCITNDDVSVENDFVKNLLDSAHAHGGSIITGKIYYEAGFEYHKDRYEKKDLGHVLWYTGGSIDWAHATTPHRGVDEIDEGQYDVFEKTEFINGCLMLFDQSVISRVGWWDESYFLYFEDADFCVRAQRKNVSLYYDPSIVIWHKVSQSTGGSGSKLHVKYQERNRLRFGLKYAPFWTKLHLVKNYLFFVFLKRRELM